MVTFCAIWSYDLSALYKSIIIIIIIIIIKIITYAIFCQHLCEESGGVNYINLQNSKHNLMQSPVVILTEFHFSIVGQQNILTFDVPMNNSVRM